MIIAVNFPIKATRKKKPEKNQGFNGIWTRDLRDTGAMLYQRSYEATHWEWDQFIELISPVRSEMMWSLYEIIRSRFTVKQLGYSEQSFPLEVFQITSNGANSSRLILLILSLVS